MQAVLSSLPSEVKFSSSLQSQTIAKTYKEIWAVDFEFYLDVDLKPHPVCLVARELKSGKERRVWREEMGDSPPYSVDDDALFVAYYASAEVSCHLALGWPRPRNVLDLFAEFRTNTNPKQNGSSLINALMYYGIDCIAAHEKADMRALILGAGPWDDVQRAAILDYCASDVNALAQLLPAMLPEIDLPRAVLRGRYMATAAQIEAASVPIDRDTLLRLINNWDAIKLELVARIDQNYGVYDAATFKYDRFASWLKGKNIAWPHLESGRLDLSDDTFREMARVHPSVAPLRELRHTLGQLRLQELAVGSDARNRVMLSAFRAKTGRNQPSNSKFIFGPSAWLRGLIKPKAGWSVAYIDWNQQEFGIAAALSKDPLMIAAYESGDPYLEFAKQAGAVPQNATKATHKAERELFKACVLAVQYGMGELSLAQRIGKSPIEARELLALHRKTYRRFWEWSDAMLDDAMLTGRARTVFGWTIKVDDQPNSRSLRNFHMQANGAEMLRLACCSAVEQGIEVCAPIHDAVLICAPDHQISSDILRMQQAMADASSILLDGFKLRTDVEVVQYPDRYMDARGEVMWTTIMQILDEIEARTAAPLQHAILA